jgi:SAM-dependent methyltransferase
MSLFGKLHEAVVKSRRAEVLARHVAELLPNDARVLDIGCGDGKVAARIAALRSDAALEGVDVIAPRAPCVAVRRYDGRVLPYATGEFDAALLLDVVHHAAEPHALLAEAARVASAIVIKDHFASGRGSALVLRFMDWAGNARHGVDLRYEYWSEAEWRAAWKALGFELVELRRSLGLYPRVARWLFERDLHFVALLETRNGSLNAAPVRPC